MSVGSVLIGGMRIGFESSAPLAVSQVDDTTWGTTSSLVFHGVLRDGTPFVIDVPIGSLTNWANIPAVASWAVPKMTGAPAALAHDYCYETLCPSGVLSYQDADWLFEQMLRSLRVPAPTRWLMWAAVRWYSIVSMPGGARGIRADLPALIAITVPGLMLFFPSRRLISPMAILAGCNYVARRIEWPSSEASAG